MKNLLATFVSMSLLVGCGDDAPPAHVIQINSEDIVQTAVDRIEIVMRPGMVNQQFQMAPDMSHFGGTAISRVTGAGEFVILLEKGYVDARAEQSMGVGAFLIDVPVSPVTAADPGADPTVEVTFIRGTERIADGQRFLDFPLLEGARSIVSVRCKRTPVNFGPQCTNNDPAPGSSPTGDAGL